MTTETAMRDIEAINLQVILVIRQLATHSPSQASILFGLTPEVVERIGQMDLGAIRQLAGTHLAQYRPVLTEEMLDAAITEAEAGNDHGVTAIMDVATMSS